jgi:TctA family transporter
MLKGDIFISTVFTRKFSPRAYFRILFVSIDFYGELKARNYLKNWNQSTLFLIFSRRIGIFSTRGKLRLRF